MQLIESSCRTTTIFRQKWSDVFLLPLVGGSSCFVKTIMTLNFNDETLNGFHISIVHITANPKKQGTCWSMLEPITLQIVN